MGWWGQGGRDIQWQKPRPRGTSAFPQAPEAHKAREPGAGGRRMSERVSRDQEELPERILAPQGGKQSSGV